MVDDSRWVDDGVDDGVNEEMVVGRLSNTMFKGKQNNTDLGRDDENGEIYDAQSRDRRNRFYSGFVDGLAAAAHGTPSFLNISSNVLKATGLTKLQFRWHQQA